MDKNIKKKWLEALRSGDYEQGTGFLCRVVDGKAKYCCLGVLTEVMRGEECWDLRTGGLLLYNGRSGLPANEIYKEAGLGRGVPLSSMNDRGASFEEIADYIEKEY